MICLLALLLSASASLPAHAQTVDWNGDPAARFAQNIAIARKKEQKSPKDASEILSAISAPDSDRLTPEQLACRPDVIAGFKRIFQDSGSGNSDTESAMRIDFFNNRRVIYLSPQTHEFKRMEVPISSASLAIAHTHPSGNYHPSGQDESSPVPNFVVTRWALWVTNPKPAKHEPHSRKVRDGDWMNTPCPPGQ